MRILKSVGSEQPSDGGRWLHPSLRPSRGRNLVLISTPPSRQLSKRMLTAEIGDPGQVGIAIVAPGILQEASWRLVATADGQLEVPPLGRQSRAQRVSNQRTSPESQALLGLAARRGDCRERTPPYDHVPRRRIVTYSRGPKVEVPTTRSARGESVSRLSAQATPLPTVEVGARRGDVASDTPPYDTFASTGSSLTGEVQKLEVPTTVLLEGESVEPSVAPSAQATPLATVRSWRTRPARDQSIAAAPATFEGDRAHRMARLA